MPEVALAFTDDLSVVGLIVVAALTAVTVALLLTEQWWRRSWSPLVALSGVLAAAAFAAAVVRPVQVAVRGSSLGPRVVVLVDESRRLLLPANQSKKTRRQRAAEVVEALRERYGKARLSLHGFEDDRLTEIPSGGLDPRRVGGDTSDLVHALDAIGERATEQPAAVIVVSDGRLTRPGPKGTLGGASGTANGVSTGPGGILHTVRLADTAPRDASIRRVRAAGAAVAHQPLELEIEVGCSGGLACGAVPVKVEELLLGEAPSELATGVANVQAGTAVLKVSVALERAGRRIVRVSIDAPAGDEVPANDQRILSFSVARERVRLLHVAGRPTYDVRALRRWLKSDRAVDVVAFFILRTEDDDPGTAFDSELALIPFPVNDLFTRHLPSFDAVILQDIDAIEFKLERHLPSLARYVERGGGLITVGGPAAYTGGGYAGSALSRVLPVSMLVEGDAYDTVPFTPDYTVAGRGAPVTRSLRELFDERLPEQPGVNLLGPARPGAIVLWTHPRRQAKGAPMPVLALGEAADGRAISLAVDGTHRLAFSSMAAEADGRGYGALWDGLLGWLMRDPRYEAVRMGLSRPCVVGRPVHLALTRIPGVEGDLDLTVTRLGAARKVMLQRKAAGAPSQTVNLGKLPAGGYAVQARVGKTPPTRFDFACEEGGDAFADSRPDPDRLRRLSDESDGASVSADAVASLPVPAGRRVATERRVTPIAPAWAWTLAAAALLGAHWLLRRRAGLP